jgi:hypothetical protein
MGTAKTRSLEKIDQRMSGIPEDSIRYRVLRSARNFKSSWIELGQSLYAVWKEKSYKDWGYLTFEAYTSKEIGIRKTTAIKLLKSYYFLEQEDPSRIHKEHNESPSPASLPTYESVNLLRLAKKNSALDSDGYTQLKKGILEMGKDANIAKKELTSMIRQKEELQPAQAREKRRVLVIKRLLTSLKTLKTDIETSKMLPASLVRDISVLINKVEDQI